jgi:PleD family two-component response regulator
VSPPTATTQADSKPKDTRGRGITVLVIDDSAIARARMVDMLTAAGFEVAELPSPIGATRLILQRRVSVVVVDVLMPGMRGDRLAALFRGNPRFAEIGVVLVSGEARVRLDRLLTETGADATVSKSNLGDLVPTVLRVRRERKEQSG